MCLDHQVINCPIRKKCFLVDVLLTKNVDHINWTLNLVELHQYLISLLRKMQNTFLELVLWNLADGNCFPKKETFYQSVDHISRILNVPKLCWYLISLLRKMQNTFLELAVSGFGRWESFPKKDTFHHMIENYFWIMFHFDSYIT